ncbi:unnamed protein product, partial [Gulo gulo]
APARTSPPRRTCRPTSTPPGRRCAPGTASARTASSCMGRASARCPPCTWPPATSALQWCCTRRSPRACALPSLTPRRPTASMRSPTSRRCPRSRHRCSSSPARRTKQSTSPTGWRSMSAAPRPWSRCGWRVPGTMASSSTASTWSACAASSPRSCPTNRLPVFGENFSVLCKIVIYFIYLFFFLGIGRYLEKNATELDFHR